MKFARLSPALFQRPNVIKWYPVLLALLLLNASAIFMFMGIFFIRYQRYFIYLGYFPFDSRKDVESPLSRGIDEGIFEDLTLRTPDDVDLHARYFKFPKGERMINPEKGIPSILFFHGTSGNIGHRNVYAKTLFDLCECNILLLSYRGYGWSGGESHRAGIQQDSQAALDYLITRPEVDASKIFVLGQSIGGAVTLDLVARNPEKIKGFMVENTFTRVKQLMPEVIPPFAPLRELLTEDWDSLAAIQSIPGRLPNGLFLVGEQDELINPKHIKNLYHTARKLNSETDKEIRMYSFANGFHVHTYREPLYFDIIAEFINEISDK